MKKTLIAVLAVILLLATGVGCSNPTSDDTQANNPPINTNTQGTKVYALSGENDFIIISNGAIVLTSGLEKFVGGNLSFKGDGLEGIKNYITEFYFFMDGVKYNINNNVVSIEGSEDGIDITPDLGSTSAETIFSAAAWNTLTEAGAFRVNTYEWRKF